MMAALADHPQVERTPMKTTKLVSALLALAFAVVGLAQCGEDSVCDRAKKLEQNFAPCAMPGMTMMTKCNEPNCSAADKEKVSAFLDCAEAVGVCVKGKEFEWVGKFVMCAPKLEGVSETCAGQ
jgi:hypothetical protein